MSDAARRRLLLATYFVSGIPGLMAQLAWARVFAAGLGHEVPSLLGVTSAFLLGLAGGAMGWDRLSERVGRAGRGYARLEGFSSAWILLSLPFLGDMNRWALGVSAISGSALVEWGLAFGIPALVIGPAAAAMGATFPAMERALSACGADRRNVAVLYAVNTAGAVTGVAWAVAVWMPQHGFRATLIAAAMLQAACAVVAWWATRRVEVGGTRLEGREARAAMGAGVRDRALWFVTGTLGLAYQWTVVRVVAQVLENTVQTFAWCLAMSLAGTTAGAWWERRHGAGLGDTARASVAMPLAALTLVVVGQHFFLGRIFEIHRTFEKAMGVRGAEWGVALLAFGVPAVLMGQVFSRMVQNARGVSGGVGMASGWNTLGSAFGGPLVMLAGIPWLGTRHVLGGVALGYVALALRAGGRARWRLGVGVALVTVGGVVLAPDSLVSREGIRGAQVTHVVEGPRATVTVERTADGHRTLRVNHRFQQGGTASAVAARRQGHLPLLLHPGPRRALFLGVGTGMSLGVVRAHEGLQAVGVELLPEVVSVLDAFEPENGSPHREGPVRVVRADARRYLRSTAARYDVVVADLFHPAEDGAGFLYTYDHFEAMRRVLAPGGLACQWLPLHQMDLGVLRDVIRTFSAVFPHRTLWLLRFNVDAPVVGLVGSDTPLSWDPQELSRRMERGELSRELAPLALNNALRVLGCLMADALSLEGWMGHGPIATDDWPLVLFRAPQAVYRKDAMHESPADRLVALLDQVRCDPRSVMHGDTFGEEATRWAAFVRARNAHLRGLAEEGSRRLDKAVANYLESVAASPDYTAGYAQVVLVASAYRTERAAWAEGLLRRLIELRPEQSLARELLQRWGGR